MVYREENQLIVNATFSTPDGQVVTFKDLPMNKTFIVNGELWSHSKPITAKCSLRTPQELVIDGKVYNFIPKDSHGVQNAIKLYNVYYVGEDSFPWTAEDAKKASPHRIIMAIGVVIGHYRELDGTEVRTSPILRFYEVNKRQYIDTRNATYHIATLLP